MHQPGKTSRGEFRATVLLTAILAGSILIPRVIDLFHSDEAIALPETISVPAAHQDSLSTSDFRGGRTAGTDGRRTSSRTKTYPVYRSERDSHPTRNTHGPDAKSVTCYAFDPNTVKADTLIAMGLNPVLVRNLVKYRDAGGRFRKPEDLRRIYGMDSTTYHTLSGCIRIPSANPYATADRPLDINSAGIEEWRSLPGIGEVLAKRIVAFRTRLGGFHSIEQVRETYGLPPETMDAITGKLSLTVPPMRIDLNTATLDQLDAHPYITRRQAETIVSYRTHHGKFEKVEDILQIYSLNAEWLARIGPYLSCDTENHCDLAAR